MSVAEPQPAAPPPTRRWLRFSLRTLLVFVTLAAVGCSWLAVKLRQSEREAAAAAAIVKSGGAVEWNDDEHPYGPAWLRRLLGEHCLAHVKVVGWYVDLLNLPE